MGDAGTAHDLATIPNPTTLLQVRAGKIKPLGSMKSAIDKRRQLGPVKVTKVGVDGDEQDYAGHGGVDKALHWYCADHYDDWKKERPSSAHLFKAGGFGENLVVKGLNEENVCIGDSFSIGDEVLVQVSEPRQPCFKLNKRFDWDDASMEIQRSKWTGWYLRVLKTGKIEEGAMIRLLERPNPRWTINNVSEILYEDLSNEAALRELSELPGMGLEIRQLCAQRLQNTYENQAERLRGSSQKTWWKSRLVRRNRLTRKVVGLCFETEIDGNFPEPELGEFAHMRIRFGPGQCFTRAYSIVSGDFRAFELGVSLEEESTGGSRFLHQQIRAGDVVEVARGFGSGKLPVGNETSFKHLFIVGGIGITAFIKRFGVLQRACADYEIHYAVRGGPEDAVYRSSLDASRTSFYYSNLFQRLNVSKVISADLAHSQHTILYCCGPSSLNAAVQARCDELKWSPSLLHFEDFGRAAVTGTQEPFDVDIYSENGKKEVTVPENRSLLQVLRREGLRVESSCESGSCGMCKVSYSAGEVHHRGVALSEDDKSHTMLSCVSRATGRLFLDF